MRGISSSAYNSQPFLRTLSRARLVLSLPLPFGCFRAHPLQGVRITKNFQCSPPVLFIGVRLQAYSLLESMMAVSNNR
ncbi:hypothetical protein BJX99DRAFT_109947 [Aspergillus californicus]